MEAKEAMKEKLSRREFLKKSAVAGAGMVAASVVPKVVLAEKDKDKGGSKGKAPKGEEVTLDIMSPLSEYEGPYREIWNVYEEENPNVKINLFSINEDTAAAHEAKVAGGFLPGFECTQELQIFFGKDNYQLAVDLSSFPFEWWDRFSVDVEHAWPDLFNLPGPRSLDIFQGYVITWQYNGDLMDKAKLDPYNDVKVETWEDMKDWLDEGAKWAAATPGVDYFWDQGWHNWGFGMLFSDSAPLAFADGTRELQRQCFLGKKKFNAPDSPYRHFYEFYKEANDKGWIPPSMWTRIWEGDMEAGYIGGTSVMMLHGPWVWDKALAAGSTFDQRGWPCTPPAKGNDTWRQFAMAPGIDWQFFIRSGNETQPQWPQVQHAWNWFFSPKVVAWRAQAEGRAVIYRLDETLDIQGPQYQGIVKHIENPDGNFPQVKWEQTLSGIQAATPYRKKGAKGVWDWATNGNNEVFRDLLTGKIDVKGALDIAQRNWEETYEGLPV
jgi:ABC-type glycerol-3-phosphate transport system substrate-binding protein